MAEENNTIASEPTTEAPAPAPADPSPPADQTSSTTENPPADDVEPTLLTPADDKPADDKPADDKPAANAALFGAPEASYEITGLPEGVTVDTEALAAFEPIAKELGLSNEGMSKVAAAYTQILPQVEARIVDALQSDIAAQQASWANDTIEAVKTNPVFEGKPLADVQAVAAKALDRFGSPEFRQFLADTGLGNNPEMMKFAYQAGSKIAEDNTFERGGTPPVTKSRTEKYYGPQT
jgi:hypothetical protein